MCKTSLFYKLAIVLSVSSSIFFASCKQSDRAPSEASSSVSQSNANSSSSPKILKNDSEIITEVVESQKGFYKPKKGFAPDEKTAIRIAEAVWKPIYGEETIEREKPFQARLKDGIWHVSGSLREGWDGGTAEAEISKDTGCVLMIYHGK